MDKLVAIVYPEKDTAEEVYEKLQQLQAEHLIDVHDAAYATKDKSGKLKLHQESSMTGAGAAYGGMWGLLIGALFFAPVFGLLLGAGLGAVAGKVSDYGIDDKFMKDLASRMKTNDSAIFMLVGTVVVDKVLPEISQYGGEILQTSLSKEAEAKLHQALKKGTSQTPVAAHMSA